MLTWNFLLPYQKVAYLKCIKCFGYFNFFICLLNLDLWFWIGQGGRIRRIPPHDSGSCHSVLPGSRNPDGQPALQQRHRHLVRRLHLCRTTWAKNIVSGTESHTAGIMTFPLTFCSTASFHAISYAGALWTSNLLLFCLVYTQANNQAALQRWDGSFQTATEVVVINISFWNVRFVCKPL